MENSKHMTDKGRFLRHVLATVNFEDSATRYVLNFLILRDPELKNVTFVDSETSLGVDDGDIVFIEMSSRDSAVGGVKFLYKDSSVRTEDPSKGFVHFKKMCTISGLQIHLKLNLAPGENLNNFYLFVEQVGQRTEEVSKEISDMADQVISESLIDYELGILMDKIDESLVSGDRKAFEELSKIYVELLGERKESSK